MRSISVPWIREYCFYSGKNPRKLYLIKNINFLWPSKPEPPKESRAFQTLRPAGKALPRGPMTQVRHGQPHGRRLWMKKYRLPAPRRLPSRPGCSRRTCCCPPRQGCVLRLENKPTFQGNLVGECGPEIRHGTVTPQTSVAAAVALNNPVSPITQRSEPPCAWGKGYGLW